MTVQRAIPRVSQLQDVQGCGFSRGYARRHVHLRGKEEASRNAIVVVALAIWCQALIVPSSSRQSWIQKKQGSIRSFIREKSAIRAEDLFDAQGVCHCGRDENAEGAEQ